MRKGALKERVVDNKITTIAGSVIGAGLSGAYLHWQNTGGLDMNWQSYAVAAGAAAVPVLVGALMKDPKKK